eukprot:6395527-Amphidinium_carterae.2
MAWRKRAMHFCTLVGQEVGLTTAIMTRGGKARSTHFSRPLFDVCGAGHCYVVQTHPTRLYAHQRSRPVRAHVVSQGARAVLAITHSDNQSCKNHRAFPTAGCSWQVAATYNFPPAEGAVRKEARSKRSLSGSKGSSRLQRPVNPAREPYPLGPK